MSHRIPCVLGRLVSMQNLFCNLGLSRNTILRNHSRQLLD
jgi:hypothetical protein